LLYRSGIRENAFRAAYDGLTDRPQQQQPQQTYKPKISRFYTGKPLSRLPAVKIEAKPKLSRNSS